MSKYKVKSMLIVFFDSQGIVHKEFISQGNPVNAAFYKEVPWLKNVSPGVSPTWSAIDSHSRLTLPSSAPLYWPRWEFRCYSTLSTAQMCPPPDLFLFPLIKMKLKGISTPSGQFKKALTDELKAIPEDV
uniref:Uncharacterized protein n=1 Tax=Homalodisca liturata TaxID=320908 RepID=A0A1B6JCE9_9HEMI